MGLKSSLSCGASSPYPFPGIFACLVTCIGNGYRHPFLPVIKGIFDVVRLMCYITYIDVTSNGFLRPQFQPLETLRKWDKLILVSAHSPG
jgi:hypothetical protein